MRWRRILPRKGGETLAKKIKNPKSPKQPKPVFKVKLGREERKRLKEKAKRLKKIKKGIDTSIGVVAVLLCIVSSVLDVVLNKQGK